MVRGAQPHGRLSFTRLAFEDGTIAPRIKGDRFSTRTGCELSLCRTLAKLMHPLPRRSTPPIGITLWVAFWETKKIAALTETYYLGNSPKQNSAASKEHSEPLLR